MRENSGVGRPEVIAMNVGRALIIFGLVLVAVGLVSMLASKLGLPKPGRLPGDLVYRGKNTVFYFPVVTSIVLSILVTLLVSLFQRFR